MKNLLKKLSRFEGSDRRAELEREAAEHIKSVGGERPAEAAGVSAWGAPSVPAPAPEPAPTSAGGRRLTVQERLAARELEGQAH